MLLTEVSYVTVRLAQEFEKLESRDPGPWEESLTLTLCSRNGTRFALTPAEPMEILPGPLILVIYCKIYNEDHYTLLPGGRIGLIVPRKNCA